jgi:hypothetical protein
MCTGHNVVSIQRDPVGLCGFLRRYKSVKQFEHTLRKREPERFGVLEHLLEGESPIDYGWGALTVARTPSISVRAYS